MMTYQLLLIKHRDSFVWYTHTTRKTRMSSYKITTGRDGSRSVLQGKRKDSSSFSNNSNFTLFLYVRNVDAPRPVDRRHAVAFDCTGRFNMNIACC